MRGKEKKLYLYDTVHLQSLPQHYGIINMGVTIQKHYKKASISNQTREEEIPALLIYVNKALLSYFN